MADMSGKTVVVTGASSGIGRQVAIRLARSGARLVLVGRSLDRLEETRRALGGQTHQIVSADLRDADEIALLPGRLRDVRAVDSLIQCAGVFDPLPFPLTTAEVFDRLWTTNVRAPFLVARALLERMSSASTMVFVSSVSGHTGMANQSAYGATKSAVEGLTRSLAVELAPRGVRVNCVAPGFTETAMNEDLRQDSGRVERLRHAVLAGRLGEPDEVARALEFLAGPESSYVYGVILHVDGGYPISDVQRGVLR